MSLLPTRMLNLQTTYEGKLDSAENRMSRWPILMAFKEDTNHPEAIVDGQVKQRYFDSISRSGFQIPVFNRFTPAIGSARTCTIADPETTTALQNVVSTTYSWGFTIVPSINEGNLVPAQKEFNHKYLSYVRSWANTVETACVSALNTNKSQKEDSSFTGAGTKYGDFETADEISVASGLRTGFFNDMESVMNANDFYADGLSRFNVFGSTSLRSVVNTLGAGGTQNATNTQYQLPNFDFKYSNRVTVAGANLAEGYVLPKGQVGILTRLPWEHRQGTFKSGIKTFSSEVEPVTGFTMGTLYYDDCEDKASRDGAASAHATAAHTEHYGWNCEVALFTPYNSDAANLAGPIYKFVMTNA